MTPLTFFPHNECLFDDFKADSRRIWKGICPEDKRGHKRNAVNAKACRSSEKYPNVFYPQHNSHTFDAPIIV